MDRHEPALQLGGLTLWVFGRRFPDLHDYWDGNWLNVRARVDAPGATVEVSGAIIRNNELESFGQELSTLLQTLKGRARLACLEPHLGVEVEAISLGHFAVKVSITPDPLTQAHEFKFSLDQSYLEPVVSACERIISEHPIRGADRR